MSDFESQDRTILHELGAALTGHKLVIGLALVFAVFGAYASLQFTTEQYESSVGLLVKLGRENTEVPVTVDKGTVLSTGVRKEEINSEIQLLTSRDLIETSLDEVGLEAFRFLPSEPRTFVERIKFEVKRIARALKAELDELLILANLRKRLSEREKVLVLLERSLKVDREKDSDVISARLRLPDPDLAVRFLDVLVRHYMDRHVEVRRDREMSDFFAQQVDSYRQQLHSLGQRKQSVQDERRIAAIAEQRALLLRRQRDLRDQIEDLERERRLIASSQSAAATAGPVRALSSYPSLDLLKTKLTELRLKRTDLLKRYKPDSHLVQDVDEEIVQIESITLRATEATMREKRVEIGALETMLDELSIGERELETVDQERQAAVQNFLVYSKRMEEARVAEQLDLRRISNIVVLGAPERPIQPVYPKKLLIMGASLPLGLMLGLALALMLEYLNKTIRGPHDLDALPGVKFLGRLRVPKGDLR